MLTMISILGVHYQRWYKILLMCFMCKLCWGQSDEIKSTLLSTSLAEIQNNVNANTSAFCFHGHSGSKQAFINNKYALQSKTLNVLIYPFCLVTSELGNRLGNYFSEIGCAHAAGLHFVSVHHQWDIKGSFHGNATNTTYLTDKSRLAFLNGLPSYIEHKFPLDRSSAVTKLTHVCKCTRYCWENGNAPWVNMTAQIGSYIRNAVSAYVSSIDTSSGTTVDAEVDLSNVKPGVILPIVPDVALQYRCGDNIGFSYMYGILPFAAFKPLIPADSKYIYVLSDHPSRAAHSVYSGRCSLILKALMEYLQVLSPHATIVVKRGGDLFLDYVRLSRAKVTICSASSYCLWPAIANVNGSVHFPLTSLAAGADSIELAPDLGSHFHWIAEPKIISNFKNVRPWTAIIDILRADAPVSKPA